MLPFPIAIAAAKPFPLALSPTTSDVTGTVADPNDNYAGIKFFSNGTHFKTGVGATSESYGSSLGNWLDQGNANRVWIQWVRTGGTLGDWNVTDAGDSRLNFDGSDYAWCISRTSLGTNSIIGHFDFYDAESGGNLLASTGTITISATVESGS